MGKELRSILFCLLLLCLAITEVKASSFASIVAYAPETDILAVGYSDDFELMKLSDHSLIASIPSPYQDPEGRNSGFRITEMVFNSSGTQLAVSYSGFEVQNYIFIVNAFTGEVLHSISEGYEVFSLAWHPDGSQLAAKIKYGSIGMTFARLLVWDAMTGNQLVYEDIGADIITYSGLDWRADATQLALAYANSIDIWDTTTWTPTNLSLAADAYIFDVYWNDDFSQIIALDYERTLYAWDSTTGELIHKIQNGLTEYIYEIAVSEDNKVAITGWQDIIIWDLSSEPSSSTIHVEDAVTDVVWRNNHELIYSSWGGYYIYDIVSTTIIYPTHHESEPTTTPTSSP